MSHSARRLLEPAMLQPGPVARLQDLRQRLIGYHVVNLRRHIDAFATVRCCGVSVLVPARELAARTRARGAEPIMTNLRETLLRRRHLAGFRPFVPAGVLDLGARYGLFSVMARLAWPQARIAALEADPRYAGAIDMCAIVNGIDVEALAIAAALPENVEDLGGLLDAHGFETLDFLKADAGEALARFLLVRPAALMRVNRAAIRFDAGTPAGTRVLIEQALARAGMRIALAGTRARMSRAFLPDAIYASRMSDLAL